ncbi:MAG TPA: galactitol-1-phosphate 5-dehydrogenase [Armatimonadota bacterium]
MNALVLTEYNHLEIQDRPAPVPGPKDALIRVAACGICGSDIHGMDGSTGRRKPPIVMGHEASGVIAEIGPEVDGWSIGDRVTFDSTLYCGECFYCRRGQIDLCDNRQVLGVSCDDYRRDGAFAEYVAVPAHILYALPNGLSFEHAAMAEALSIAFHAARRTPVTLNDTAVVVGAGMIGLLVVQALRLSGCGRILAVDLDPAKLALACRLGADAGLLAGSEDPAARVADHTHGRGADLVVECVGLSPSLRTALSCVRKGGHVTLVGNLAPNTEFPLQSVVTRELTLAGSCASAGEYPACLEMMASGRVNVDALISACAPMEEGPSWFHRLASGEPGLMKVILTPDRA